MQQMDYTAKGLREAPHRPTGDKVQTGGDVGQYGVLGFVARKSHVPEKPDDSYRTV